MHNALQRHYGIDEKEAAEVMRTLVVIHPYGTIAELPWENRKGVPIGSTASRANMQLMASRIKTFTEQIESDATLSTLHEEIQKADTLVFLGFSYHPKNMRILAPPDGTNLGRVYGTALGISLSDVGVIFDQILILVGHELSQSVTQTASTTVHEPIFIRNDLPCFGLLQEFSRSLFGRSQH
jgi:hypothetical protein